MPMLAGELEAAPFLGLATASWPYINPLSCISNSSACKRQLSSLGLMAQGVAQNIACSLQYLPGLGTHGAFGHE